MKNQFYGWPKLQITRCDIKNNLEVFGAGQNNNLVSTVKFLQNTWRIPLVCHTINRMMTHITIFLKKI